MSAEDDSEVRVVREVIPGGEWTLRMALRKFFGQTSTPDKLRAFQNVIEGYILYLKDEGYDESQLEVYKEILVRYKRLLARYELALSYRNVGEALEIANVLSEVVSEFMTLVPTDVLREEVTREVRVRGSGVPEDAGGVLA